MNIFEFNPQIYPRRLWVSVGASVEELQEKFGKVDIKDIDDSCYADTYSVQQKEPLLGGTLIRFKELAAMTTENIAHEATHAALVIYDYIGGRIDYYNQEPFAYIVGWVAKCCDEVKNNLQKTT